MDNLNRVLRQFKPILLNNRGFILINRDPNAGGEGGGGGAGAGGAGGEGGGGAGGGEGGGQPNEFFQSIPEEIRKASLNSEGKSSLEKFNSLDGMAKSYLELEKKISAKGVIIPGDNAKPEEITAFHRQLGMPETPEGYKFDKVENVHAAIGNAAELETGLKKEFHSMGLPNKWANILHQKFIGMLSQSAELQEAKQNEARQNAEGALRKKWGSNYDTNVAKVGQMAMRVGGKEFIDAMGGAEGLGNNPVVMDVLAKVFSGMSEDQIKNIEARTTTGGGSGNLTGDKLKAKQAYDQMMAGEGELGKALWSETDPKHSEALKEKQRLAEIIYAEEANV